MILQEQYQKRKNDVNVYFDFMSSFDRLDVHKHKHLYVDDSKAINISRDTQKVIRSNSFLLLYNLVEMTIRSIIWNILDAIEDDEIVYEDLSEKLKDVWLKEKTKELRELIEPKKTISKIQSLVEIDPKRERISFNRNRISISGNIDYREIKSLLIQFGIFGSVLINDEKALGKALLKVKNERNSLAHGNKSFIESAEVVTIQQLEKYKILIFNYLDQIVSISRNYVDEKKYRK